MAGVTEGTLTDLLHALPARDCLPKVNPNCDDCLSTGLRANGFQYVDNVCALQPCWTPEIQ